jgi:precorrin-6Y C5,15-methyltransferase (decarboxylating)
MTKSEVRAVTLSRLSLKPTDICCDIGAGTGSVTVEMALAAYKGHVYAIDKEEKSIELIKQNCRAFHIGNVSPICVNAPDALASLPKLNAAFIGGSGGNIQDIVSALLRNNPDVRIVANAVALESVTAAIEAFRKNGLTPEVMQISCARAQAVGALHMMTAQNPVFIISGGGK